MKSTFSFEDSSNIELVVSLSEVFKYASYMGDDKCTKKYCVCRKNNLLIVESFKCQISLRTRICVLLMKLCLSWCMILPKLTKQCEELLFFIYGKGGGSRLEM